MTLESIVRILRITLSRPVLLAVAGGSLLLLAGECRRFADERAEASRPRVAIQVKAVQRYRPEVLDARLRTYRPSASDAAKLSRRSGVPIRSDSGKPDPTAHDLLAHVELEPLCDGGEILVTLPPGADERAVQVTVLPRAPKLLSLRSAYEVGAVYGRSAGGEARGRAWAAVEPLRFGQLHLRGEAGVDLRGGEADAYVMGGVVWRWR